MPVGRVSACRFQRRAAAVEGDIIRHIQNDIIAASRHANACAPHFRHAARFPRPHVVTHAAAWRRQPPRQSARLTAIFFEEESAPMLALTSDPIPAPMPEDLPASRSLVWRLVSSQILPYAARWQQITNTRFSS